MLLTAEGCPIIIAIDNVVTHNELGAVRLPEEKAGALLREVAVLFARIQREGAACCGATATQCSLLTELGRSGPVTLAELGRSLGLDKGWISRTVDALVVQGLVEKQPGAADRRTVLLSLTDAGQRQTAELNGTLNSQSDRIMSRVPAEERPQVIKALETLLSALRAERETVVVELELEAKEGEREWKA